MSTDLELARERREAARDAHYRALHDVAAAADLYLRMGTESSRERLRLSVEAERVASNAEYEACRAVSDVWRRMDAERAAKRPTPPLSGPAANDPEWQRDGREL